MTYPGYAGQVGPPPTNTIGWPVRQSRAGRTAGVYSAATSVLDAMGSHAPVWGLTAQANTLLGQVSRDPFAIDQEDFERNFDRATTKTPDVGSPADYTGEGGSFTGVIGADVSTYPVTFPFYFQIPPPGSTSDLFTLQFPFIFTQSGTEVFTLRFPYYFQVPDYLD